MLFDTYETDLLILPETTKERNNLQSYCITNKLIYSWEYSNIKGQKWHDKQYLTIPFRIDLKHKIEKYFKKG